jgi:hypothetical protein
MTEAQQAVISLQRAGLPPATRKAQLFSEEGVPQDSAEKGVWLSAIINS